MAWSEETQQYDELLNLIYDSIHDSTSLAPAMDSICRRLGAVGAHYVHFDATGTGVIDACVNNNDYQAADIEYRTYYCGVDMRLEWLTGGLVGEWRADHDRFGDDVVRRSEIYNDFLFKYGARHIISSVIGVAGGGKETVSFLRPLGAPEYGQEERHFLRQLSAHWVRSATLRARLRTLESQRQQAEQLAGMLPFGTVWASADGRILDMNEAAAAILRRADGLSVRSQRLRAADVSCDRQLQQALRQAAAPTGRRGEWFTVRRTSSARPLLVSVVPARGSQQDGTAVALVVLQDVDPQKTPRGVRLRGVFGLTVAEARLAEALLDNETVESYAARAGVTRNTVRTHLASLFAKTGTRRQAELLCALLAVQPVLLAKD